VSRAVTLIYGHPYPDRSRAGRVLLDGVRDLPGVEVRSLYDLYPDFDIDVQGEQSALLKADLIVWQCPFYWYGVPALVNLWFEKVLAQGWAYGEGADALSGKTVLWATTTGGSLPSYSSTGMHGHPFGSFVPAISQVARFCGMLWAEPPLVVHGAHRLTLDELREAARNYRRRIESLAPESRSRAQPAESANGG
jgi:glutathione-regulated potassium-efflux system ancillary protein KefF